MHRCARLVKGSEDGEKRKESLLCKRPARPAKPGETITMEGAYPFHASPKIVIPFLLA